MYLQGAEAPQIGDSHSSKESADSPVNQCKCQTVAQKPRSLEAYVEIPQYCHKSMTLGV